MHTDATKTRTELGNMWAHDADSLTLFNPVHMLVQPWPYSETGTCLTLCPASIMRG